MGQARTLLHGATWKDIGYDDGLEMMTWVPGVSRLALFSCTTLRIGLGNFEGASLLGLLVLVYFYA